VEDSEAGGDASLTEGQTSEDKKTYERGGRVGGTKEREHSNRENPTANCS